MRTLIFLLLTVLPLPALAQSSLGISGAQLSLGMVEDEAGDYRGGMRALVDVAITKHHGFQGDLAFSDTVTGGIGTVAAHLYMTPKAGQKYGLFAAMSDVDGRAFMYGSLGAEGMLSLGENTSFEGRAGIGWGDLDGLDYIFAGGAIAHQMRPAVEIEFAVDLADFDEPAFSATIYDATLSASFSPEGAPWGITASLGRSGDIGGGGAARLGIGVTFSFGTARGTDPHTRPFRTPDPAAPLVRRGLW